MSKLAELKTEEVYDSYLEHDPYHQSYHEDCSVCFAENRLIKAHRKVNSETHADLLKKYPALKYLDTHLNRVNE